MSKLDDKIFTAIHRRPGRNVTEQFLAPQWAVDNIKALVTTELEAFAAELRATHSGDYGENNCPICDDIDRLLAKRKEGR